MKASKVFLLSGLWLPAVLVNAVEPSQPSVTAIHRTDKVIRQVGRLRARAIIPTESGQIGINPPTAEPAIDNIEGHTKYLTEEQGTTKWIGPDPSFIAIATKTTTGADGQTGVTTITKGVEAHKNDDGSLDVLLSPAIIAKLEAIHKEVTPCGARRRSLGLRKRGGPSCGLADFLQRVGNDPELGESFSQPLNDQVWEEIDEGYASDDPAADPGWEGDGQVDAPGGDEGYFSDDDEGFFEGSEEGEAAETVEDIIIGTEEEAAALGEALSGSDAAANGAIFGGSTATVGSFLAFLWKTLDSGGSLHNANQIPKESIHKVTKTKTTSTTTTSSSCPTETPECGQGCVPTSASAQGAEPTSWMHWKCSEGDHKDCECKPKVTDHVSSYESIFDQVVLDAIAELDTKPDDPQIDCPAPPFGRVPSKWLVDDTAKNFCSDVMGNRGNAILPTAYDIDGNKIPLLRQANLASDSQLQSRSTLMKRSPPVSKDNYRDFKFFLEYKPKDGTCLVPEDDLCKNAYQALVSSNCGTNHGSVNDLLFPHATIDVGCGQFSWTVEDPPEPAPKPKLQTRQCHDRHNQDDVHSGSVNFWSGFLCEDKTMKAGDKEIYWHPIGLGADLNSNFQISWIDGCTVAQEQNILHPIEGNNDINCQQLLKDNYYQCNNGGAGGQIDAGCLRYDFWSN